MPSLLLINSNDRNAFAAIYNYKVFKVINASEFTDKDAALNKQPDKLINCIYKISQKHDLNTIDAIAVTIGPGSFTGIRVGLAIAKGLAFGLDKKIIPVNNFELTLNRLTKIDSGKEYCVLIPARLPEYYFSVIINGRETEMGYIEIQNLVNIIPKGCIIVGDFDDETSIKHCYFEYINIKNIKSEPDSMLELALKNYNKALNADKVEPLYLKDFKIKNEKPL